MVRSRFSRILVVILVALFPLSALAGNEVGKMSGNASGIDWTVTRNDHESVVLTVVAPDGTRLQKTFNGGQNPSFRTSDLKKGGSTDGTYTYELLLVPRVSGSVKSALKAARASGDDAAVASIMKANGLDKSVVQSGAFGVSGGAFLDPDAKEPTANDSAAASTGRGSISSEASTTTTRRPGTIAADDQVIPDDLIVQSSICAGFDCVDGESFGFDTIRMKENNVQINFMDTSTSAGYPANDWTIVANDSTSGGANYLAFSDLTAGRKTFLVEAGAPSNALYVDSTGNIGISQSAPGLDLHMTTTDTPAMRYEQTNGGGFTAQTWDIGANEANFFVRDVTGGSLLSFRIRPGAPTSSIDIASNGNVGIGKASATHKLHVDSAAAAIGIVWERTSGSISNKWGYQNDSAGTYLTNVTSGAIPFQILNGGNIGFGVTPSATHRILDSTGAHLTSGGAWTNASSRTFKQNVTALTAVAAMDALKQLNPVTYQYKTDPNDTTVGFIAEDVPEIVATPDRKGLSSMDVVAVLTKVVKEQQATIEQLQQRLDKIEQQEQKQ